MLLAYYAGSQMRPMIQARVSIPSINAGGFVEFILDTGADCTTLMPNDSRKMHVDYSRLSKEDHSIGSAGASLDYLCDGVVIFSEIGVVEYEYDIELRLIKPDPTVPELLMPPSLLGRDIINQWQLSFDPKAMLISANVLSCDRETRQT
jgi:hypothetical protein